MSATPDPVTVALTGQLPGVIIIGALLAFPASVFLLKRYRRAVLRGMDASAGATPPLPHPDRAAPTPPARPLQFALLGPHTAQRAGTGDAEMWRAAGVYAAAIVAFAAVMTGAWLISTGDHELGAVKVSMIFWTYFWPAVLAANLVATTDRASRIRIAAAYFALYLLLAMVALARSPALTAGQVAAYWLVTNGPPTVLLYAFLARRIRAVGPIVLAFAVLAVLGSQLAATVVGMTDFGMRIAVEAGGVLGLGGVGTFWMILGAGFLVFAVLAWAVLRWLGARYAAKRLSDETLVIDALVFLFAISQAITLVFQHWAWIASAFVAFAAYKLVVFGGFQLLRQNDAPQRLLLLRVFALGARSEPLFDALHRRWLRRGTIAMIAGPDLVTSVVQPHEFLGFLSGDLQRRFVAGDADLDRRVAAIDRRPDPDGRFRVAEFFCQADTWQPTMQRLVAESDAVLMDLRSFSAQNQGCVYELGRLLNAIDLSRVVFVIDDTTDRAFLERKLAELWAQLSAASPNRRATEPAAQLFAVIGPTAAESRVLVAQLGAI